MSRIGTQQYPIIDRVDLMQRLIVRSRRLHENQFLPPLILLQLRGSPLRQMDQVSLLIQLIQLCLMMLQELLLY